MSNKYKVKKRKKNKINKIIIILVLTSIMIVMSTAYSLLSTKLTIIGNAIGEPLDVELVKASDTRYTTNTEFKYLGMHAFVVTSETYENSTLTTTLGFTWFINVSASGTITLSIKNATNSTFYNGKMEAIELSGTNPDAVFKSNVCNIGAETLQPGETANPTIELTLTGKNISGSAKSKCRYRITYEVDGCVKAFYYEIIVNKY